MSQSLLPRKFSRRIEEEKKSFFSPRRLRRLRHESLPPMGGHIRRATSLGSYETGTPRNRWSRKQSARKSSEDEWKAGVVVAKLLVYPCHIHRKVL